MKIRNFIDRHRFGVAMSFALSLLGGAVAWSQTISVPTISTSHPFVDLLQIIPNGQPAAQSQYAPWANVTSVFGYYKAGTGTQNQTITLGTNVAFSQFANSSAINTVYIYTPTAPMDGQRTCVFSIGGITNITMYASGTQTLNNAITTLASNTAACWLYSISNTAWDRL